MSLSHHDRVELDVKFLDMQVQLLTAAKDILLQEEQKLQDDAERATTTSDEDDLLQNTGAARRRRRRRSECGCDLGCWDRVPVPVDVVAPVRARTLLYL